MKKSTQKVQQLQNLFQLEFREGKAQQVVRLRTRGMEPTEADQIEELMNFLKSEIPLPESAIDWLALLGLLYGVPFNNLVADRKMMGDHAAEGNSLHFFYLNLNWVDSLIDGAMSIGTHNSKDYQLQLAIHKAFRDNIHQAMVDHRVKLKGKPLVPNIFPQDMGTFSGLLFWSPIVSQWPGLEILGFRSEEADMDDTEAMLDILRMERLSPTLMLIIFKGVPKKVVIKEPSEGIFSGFEKNEKDQYRVVLRHTSGKDQIGKPYIDSKGNAQSYNLHPETDFRPGGKRVLNIKELKENMLQSIKKLDATVDQLSPKDMGVELINSPRFYIYGKG